MNRLATIFHRITIFLNNVAVVIAELSLFVIMLLTCYAVIARYVFRSPSIYATEVSVYLLLVGTWFSIGYIQRVNRHVRVEIFESLFPEGLKSVARWISALAILFFCVVLIWAGFLLAETAFIRNHRSTSVLRFPLWITYGLIPIGGILLGSMVIDKLISPDRYTHSENDESL